MIRKAEKLLEELEHELHPRRPMTKTEFQNVEQKQNQLLNLLVAVVKVLNEQRMDGPRDLP